MITKFIIHNFKQFRERTEFSFHPDGVTYLAGGNNSGKSSLLQALAIWEFCRSVTEVNRGKRSLVAGWNGQGIGISAAEFSPIALPDLKHLWSNLRVGGSGYTLRLRCEWRAAADPPGKFLEFGLALANDRLFFKPTDSDLTIDDRIPRLAYLPPFAGIAPREDRMLPAARKKWIGRGLAGAVLRNLLYDLYERNRIIRNELKRPGGRIAKRDLASIRRDDAWEQLLQTLEEVFKAGLSINEFNQLYHDSIDVRIWEGQLVNKQFKKKPGAHVKDLMVEGSGFLQWLSVYALALDKELNVLLLDEPDAHLHPALQGHLIHKLGQLARDNRKQVFLATHSTTILIETKCEQIFRLEDRRYLSDEGGRVKLFMGLGSAYAPRLDQLKRCRRLFLHDGPSDLEILQAWARTLGITWPHNLVCWRYTKDREARQILFEELKAEIQGLTAISLQDRDDYPFPQTRPDLTFDNLPLFKNGLGLRRWRRRNIENYLLHPDAIARAANCPIQQVQDLLRDPHGLAIPANFISSNCAQTLANTDGKEIMTRNPRSITAEFHIGYLDVAQAMQQGEIPDDVQTLLNQISGMCHP